MGPVAHRLTCSGRSLALPSTALRPPHQLISRRVRYTGHPAAVRPRGEYSLAYGPWRFDSSSPPTRADGMAGSEAGHGELGFGFCVNPIRKGSSSSLFDTAGVRKYIVASERLAFARVATAAQPFRG